MSSFSKILIHLTFSTKYREPLLPYEPFEDLHKYARGILKDMKCHLIEMNNVADHVHLLFDLHRTADVADIAMHLKKGTSHIGSRNKAIATMPFPGKQVTGRFQSANRSARMSSDISESSRNIIG